MNFIIKSIATIAMFWACALVTAQTVTVKDAAMKTPLAGVSIYNQSKTISVTTSAKGTADLAAFKAADTIVFNFIGYEQKLVSKAQLATQGNTVMLSEKAYDMAMVVVSASRFEEKKEDVPQQIEVIQAREIAFTNRQNTADLLQNSGNVYVQKSQQGGGSTVLRGFEASRVLVVVDGVRMNNAIFRAGHLQNVMRLDNNMLDKVEVVYGPGSVLYGSDALGGVMHFYSKTPQFSVTEKAELHAGAFARYSSANTEQTGHANFSIATQKIASISSFTYSNFGDMMMGNVRNPAYGDWGKRLEYVERINGADSIVVNKNPNLQLGSAYAQYDLLQKVAIKINRKLTNTVNIQYSNTSDVPRYDRLTQYRNGKLRFAEWYYGPEQRLLISNMLTIDSTRAFDNGRIVLGYQDVKESRNTRTRGSADLVSQQERVLVYSLNVDFAKKVSQHELRYGAEIYLNDVTSKANSTDINTGVKTPAETRYASGGSTMNSEAVYFTHTWEVSKKFIVTDGLRYNLTQLEAIFDDKTFFDFPFDKATQSQRALTGNLGLVYMPAPSWRFAALGSTGFRSPNVDDLSKVFESAPGYIITPNPDLKAEYTYNAELTASKVFAEKVRLEATAFYTWLNNTLNVLPSQFNGADSILYDGQMSQVVSVQNASNGYIYGGNINIKADVTDQVAFVSTLNYTYGRINFNGAEMPMDHIPPVFGKTSIVLKIKKFRGEFFALYNGWKRLKDYNQNGEDNLPQATQWGTPSWYTLNARTVYQINPNFQVQLSCDNILDLNYRQFASGFNASGRSIIGTLRYSF